MVLGLPASCRSQIYTGSINQYYTRNCPIDIRCQGISRYYVYSSVQARGFTRVPTLKFPTLRLKLVS